MQQGDIRIWYAADDGDCDYNDFDDYDDDNNNDDDEHDDVDNDKGLIKDLDKVVQHLQQKEDKIVVCRV